MVNTFDRYFIGLFFKKLLMLSLIFFSLIFILTILEEITFFSETNSEFYLPFLIAIFDAPTSLLEIFPFILLISAQLFFLEIIKKKEIELIRVNGLNNFYFIKILSICAFIFGVLIITLYYPFSSKLKFLYFDIKNFHSKDGKYLKYISSNGLWIKDEIKENIYIINGVTTNNEFLENVFISKFDKNFNLIENISSEKVNISKNKWLIERPIIFKDNKQIQYENDIELDSHFNVNKINNTFRNLNALNILELMDLKKENKKLGYSTEEIDMHILKIISLPIFFSIMVIISSIIMINIRKDKPYIFHVLLGILLSVVIYYVSNIFNILGLTDKIPIFLSIFFPLIFLSIIATIGLIKINEK
jgi:lipopolysaccharide export system permease protein